MFRHAICTVNVLLFCVSLICAGCQSAGLRCIPPYQALPAFSTLIHDDEKLISIVIKETCGGIWGLQGLSDGWSTHIVATGEDYTLTLTPPANRKINRFDSWSPQIAVMLRGEWSDCYSLQITVNFDINGEGHNRQFTLKDGISGQWVAVEEHKEGLQQTIFKVGIKDASKSIVSPSAGQ